MTLVLGVLTTARPASAANPVGPTLEVLGDIPVVATTFAADGTLIYLGAGSTLTILDTADPGNVREVGQVGPFPLPIRGMAVDGAIVYVTTGSPQQGTLHILASRESNALRELSALSLPGEPRGVALGSGRAYVWYAADARGAFGVQVVDVADPLRPFEIATWEPSECRNGIAVVDTQVLCTWAARDSVGGVVVLDAGDPQQPQPAGAFQVPGFAWGVSTEGSRAYVAWGTGGPTSPTAPGGLRILEISDPSGPQEIGTFQAGPSSDVAVQAGYAFVGTDWTGLRVLDVHNSAAPAEVAAVHSSDGYDRIAKVRVSGDRVYALHSPSSRSSANIGLCVLRFTAPGSDADDQ